MTLHAASRETLVTAETALAQALGESSADASTVGAELFSFVELLSAEVGLRRAVADGSSDPDARKRLVRALVESKLSGRSLSVLDMVVGGRWSSPRELVEGLESLSRSALLTSAQRAGTLDSVEDELFRIARVVAADPTLERALAEDAASTDAKRGLVDRLFANKVDSITRALAEQVVVRTPRSGVVAALDQLVMLAAQRRERSVAHVTTGSELSAQQQQVLATKLAAIYGRSIALHVELDVNVGGGLTIRVGDEVIDGSSEGRIASLRRQLAG